MAFQSDSLLSVELSNWCKEAVIEESHAIMLMGVLATTDVACIEEAVETIKAVGRVRVRDSKKGQSPDTVLVLCECREVIDPTRMPAELLRAEGEEMWRVIVAPVDVPASGFSEKLAKFLLEEGKSMTWNLYSIHLVPVLVHPSTLYVQLGTFWKKQSPLETLMRIGDCVCFLVIFPPRREKRILRTGWNSSEQ